MQGVRKELLNGNSLKVIDFELIKPYFMDGTEFSLCWPKIIGSNLILDTTAKEVSGIQVNSNPIQAPSRQGKILFLQIQNPDLITHK